ncbi:translation initiation factor IF-2-like [Elephas maximus indicus]|uniref:translation initiation factor IF-2-like n=1 Tax=Elephas maximus indicus TaxID=99487 RepID=UPI00211645AD|nr:translation initiation factor IF-2-like [Elephas maximus indicus]
MVVGKGIFVLRMGKNPLWTVGEKKAAGGVFLTRTEQTGFRATPRARAERREGPCTQPSAAEAPRAEAEPARGPHESGPRRRVAEGRPQGPQPQEGARTPPSSAGRGWAGAAGGAGWGLWEGLPERRGSRGRRNPRLSGPAARLSRLRSPDGGLGQEAVPGRGEGRKGVVPISRLPHVSALRLPSGEWKVTAACALRPTSPLQGSNPIPPQQDVSSTRCHHPGVGPRLAALEVWQKASAVGLLSLASRQRGLGPPSARRYPRVTGHRSQAIPRTCPSVTQQHSRAESAWPKLESSTPRGPGSPLRGLTNPLPETATGSPCGCSQASMGPGN